MAINVETLAAAMAYTKKSIEGGGAVAGKNCTIESIVPIIGGNRVTFKWYLDDGEEQTGTMDVMDGINGTDGKDGTDGVDGIGITSVSITDANHLIVTYTDGSSIDAGLINVLLDVDSELPDVSENPVQNKVVKSAIDAKANKDGAEVKTAVDEFETYNGGILSSLKVALSPNQDLHGYSEPWVGGASKNKIGASGGWNGSGVLEPSARAIRSEQIAVNEGDKFIASKAETFNATYANLQALEFDSSKAFIRQTSILAYSALNGTAFTVPSGTAYVAFSVYFNSTDEANIDAKKYKLKKATT